MMEPDQIEEAANEAARFLRRVEQWRRRHGDDEYPPVVGTPETGAVRRASMDLTRALAAMRTGRRR